ncbi:hypothetical protein HHL26_01390 [Sphingobium sp. TB-6]|uniref:hypothetical protein n=1 Tax=Sphingobium sp. TB-6 TaxID=2728850 RepID=UPI00146F8A24|nr:hypothetical protein [Sphingobium sp. TB-6]NML87723.1 hypothetical protein [Sphingobium sp. TB-6]
MEPMPGPVRIEQFHWQEGDMGEGQPVPAGDLLVMAAAAKIPVTGLEAPEMRYFEVWNAAMAFVA